MRAGHGAKALLEAPLSLSTSITYMSVKTWNAIKKVWNGIVSLKNLRVEESQRL